MKSGRSDRGQVYLQPRSIGTSKPISAIAYARDEQWDMSKRLQVDHGRGLNVEVILIYMAFCKMKEHRI